MLRETQRHQAAFELWHSTDRSYARVQQQFSVSETSVMKWAREFHWHARADARDQEAAKQAEKDAIKRRVAVLEEQRRAGELLRRRGVQYYTAHEVADGREAIAAISKGVELERQAEQLPSHLLEILNYSETELRAERERILRSAAAGLDRPPALGEGEGERDDDEPAEGLEPA